MHALAMLTDACTTLCCACNRQLLLTGKPAAKKGGIVITVQQKSFKDFDIELPAAGNLRKALMDKKVDIYPLQGKIYK